MAKKISKINEAKLKAYLEKIPVTVETKANKQVEKKKINKILIK